MPKNEIIRYQSLAPNVDGVNIPRIQTLSISADKARDPVSELGNSGIVQYIEQVPSVTVTIDTNFIGSTDTMALLNDAMIDITLASASIKTDPRYTDGTGERFETINLDTSNSASRSITEANPLDAYCHIMVPVTEDGTNVTRTAWIPRAALSGMSLSFDVNGNATENYTLQASKQAWYFNGWKNAQCCKLLDIQHETCGADSQVFYGAASAVPIGSSVLAMTVNEKIFYKTKGYQFTDPVACAATAQISAATAGSTWTMSTAADGSMEFSTPWAIDGDAVYVIFSPPDTGDLWTSSRNVSTAGSIGALARQHINIWYYNTQTTAKSTSTTMGRTLRVQSVSVEVSPGAESLLELGSKEPYGYVRNTPIPINVTMTVNDADLEIWAALAGKDWESATQTQVLLEDMNTYNNIRIDVFKEETKVVATEKTMQVLLTGLEVTGVRTNVSAGGNSTHEFTLLGDDITVVGTGINPNT